MLAVLAVTAAALMPAANDTANSQPRRRLTQYHSMSQFCLGESDQLCREQQLPSLPAQSSHPAVWSTSLSSDAAAAFAVQELSVIFGAKLRYPYAPGKPRELFDLIGGSNWNCAIQEGFDQAMEKVHGWPWAARQAFLSFFNAGDVWNAIGGMPNEHAIEVTQTYGWASKEYGLLDYAHATNSSQHSQLCTLIFEVMHDHEVGSTYEIQHFIAGNSCIGRVNAKRWIWTSYVGEKRRAVNIEAKAPTGQEPLQFYKFETGWLRV